MLTAWDGLRCVEIMEAAALSVYSGKKVSLPLPRALPSGAAPQASRLPASPEIWARGLSMPEGPAFNRKGELFVANCRSDHVSKISAEGHVELFVRTGGKPQGVAIGPDGNIFITDYIQRRIYRATPEGQLAAFCDSYADGTPLRGPNEIAFGSDGLIYFTDPGGAWRGRAFGALARLNAANKAEILLDGLEFTNGFDFSPREDAIYLAESSANRILRVPLDTHGMPERNYTEFIRFDGRIGPDGIRFAANGNLYVALFGHGEVVVVSPKGKIIERMRLPGLFPTNLIFIGNGLLVCEAQTGAIWRLPVGVPGIPSYAQRIWAAQAGESRSFS